MGVWGLGQTIAVPKSTQSLVHLGKSEGADAGKVARMVLGALQTIGGLDSVPCTVLHCPLILLTSAVLQGDQVDVAYVQGGCFQQRVCGSGHYQVHFKQVAFGI